MEAVETPKNISRGFVIPKRFIIAGLTFLIIVRSMASKSIVNTAAWLLIQQNAKKVTSNLTSICRSSQKASVKHEIYKDSRGLHYDWSPKALGSLGAYSGYGNALGYLLSGYFADVYGGKPIVSIGVLGQSVLALIMPFLVHITNRNIIVLFIERLIHGIFMGLLFPGINSILSHWIPPKERGRVCALVYTGLMIGHSVDYAATESMIKAHHDWAVPFYVYGCIGMVLLFFWWLYASSDPNSCPVIDSSENLYIEKSFKGTVDHRRKKIPFRRILRSPPVWAIMTASCSHFWGWYFSFVFQSKFKKGALGVDTPKLFSKILPWIGMFLSIVTCGFFCDLVVNKRVMNRTAIHKTLINIGNMGSPIYMLAGAYAGCHITLSNILLVIGMSSMGFVVLAMKLVIMEMTPNYTGFINGISYCASIIMTWLIPYFVAALTPDNTVLQFRIMFWVSCAICFVMNFAFGIFSKSDLQEWNTPFRFN